MATNNTLASKSKKNFKDREKRKSQSVPSDSNSNDKGSPSKESKLYAGISSDSLALYTEQSVYEHLSEEVSNILTEDINYKLRHIIHEALLKARLSGREAIHSNDIEETFSNLTVDKVYGASSNPNWLPFGNQNLLYLDDTKVNLIELAEEENTYVQQGDVILNKQWVREPEVFTEENQALKNYFVTVCQTLISYDEELRKFALKDISENPNVGPIIEWFYHFGFFLLSKNITYDCLTLRALDLIETLENSPLGNENVSEKLLRLLVRLLLQRLLISGNTNEVMRCMCSVLAILCLREPLKQMALKKVDQKLTGTHHHMVLPILTIVYFLGVDAVKEIFIPNVNYFLSRVRIETEAEYKFVALAIYNLLCASGCKEDQILSRFQSDFGDFLVPFWRPKNLKNTGQNKQVNFAKMKVQLIRTRKKITFTKNEKITSTKFDLRQIFELPTTDCKVRRAIDKNSESIKFFKSETQVTVGKFTLLLSVLKSQKTRIVNNTCHDHSLVSYNI